MDDAVIGIDLGTTYSAAAIVQDGKPVIIPSRTGERLTPSMIGFLPSGRRVLGDAARELADVVPENVAVATKRFIGRRWTPELATRAKHLVPYPLVGGPSGEIRVKLAGKTLPVTQIAAMILGELRRDAEVFLKQRVEKAVITVPANFDDGQRQATKEAARIAGLQVMRLLNEPSAAAMAYGLSHGFSGKALVFDLGGGTFDVSVLKIQDSIFEVIATGGDPQLGGVDFDDRVVAWLLEQLPQPYRDLAGRDRISLQRLRSAAEQAKRALSTEEEARVNVAEVGDVANGKRVTHLEASLPRARFEKLCAQLGARALTVCEHVLEEAHLRPKDLDAILLVGGMTRVPMIRSLAARYFAKRPVEGVNPDEVVALGAAVQAVETAGTRPPAALVDVCSHSLGVEVASGKVRKLIKKNSTVPATAKEVFLPGRTGQTRARIRVFQGEEPTADKDTFLGEVVVEDLHVENRADSPIEVTFEIGLDGTLEVRAVDVRSGLAAAARIQARTDLSAAELERLQRDEHAHRHGQDGVVPAPKSVRPSART